MAVLNALPFPLLEPLGDTSVGDDGDIERPGDAIAMDAADVPPARGLTPRN